MRRGLVKEIKRQDEADYGDAVCMAEGHGHESREAEAICSLRWQLSQARALAAATEALVKAALALDAHRRALATCAETEKYPMSDLAKALRGHAATAAAYRKAKGEGA